MAISMSQLMGAAEGTDPSAAGALFSALYSELHCVAKRELARSGGGFSLSPTTVLHQAYIDMAARDGPIFPDRPRFMCYASRVMRGLIIDHIRSRLARKRGGQFEITSLRDELGAPVGELEELTRISNALDQLGAIDPALAQIVDLKFFCGFSFSEIAAMRGVSDRTIQRQWHKARIYLHHSIAAGCVD